MGVVVIERSIFDSIVKSITGSSWDAIEMAGYTKWFSVSYSTGRIWLVECRNSKCGNYWVDKKDYYPMYKDGEYIGAGTLGECVRLLPYVKDYTDYNEMGLYEEIVIVN